MPPKKGEEQKWGMSVMERLESWLDKQEQQTPPADPPQDPPVPVPVPPTPKPEDPPQDPPKKPPGKGFLDWLW